MAQSAESPSSPSAPPSFNSPTACSVFAHGGSADGSEADTRNVFRKVPLARFVLIRAGIFSAGVPSWMAKLFLW